jgi:EF hand
MSISSVRKFYAAALCAVTACGVSLPVLAGGGPECQEKLTRIEAEGDGDGRISATEHAAGAQKRFETMDADKDGKVTASEISASHGAESVAWAKHKMSSADKINKFDTNDDGALTAAEYADGSQKMFRKLDVDADGYLSAAEMRVEPKNTLSSTN